MTAHAAVPRAVLDSNVIYSRVLHELFGRAALSGRLLDLVWSDDLLAEAERALREYKGLSAEVAALWVSHLPNAFPAGRIDPAASPTVAALDSLTQDPGDEFVCALALAGRANLLVTFDRGYLRARMRAHGVDVVHPDAWLTATYVEEPMLFERLVTEQAAAWGGGKPIGELVDAFERAQVPNFAAHLRATFGI